MANNISVKMLTVYYMAYSTVCGYDLTSHGSYLKLPKALSHAFINSAVYFLCIYALSLCGLIFKDDIRW